MAFRKRFWLGIPVVLAVGASGGVAWLVERNLPDDRTPKIPGLRAPVSVSFDDRGVARIEARSLTDAFRVQGYLTARDRMFQLEVLRRAAAGELSELFGKAALEVDRRHRTYGFARAASAAVPLLPADQREEIEAFAAGVNAFLDARPGRAGIEFAALGVEPRRFVPADALLVLLLMHEDLSGSWEREIAAERVTRVAPGLAGFLMPRASKDDVLLVADAEPVPVATLPRHAAGAGKNVPAEEISLVAPAGSDEDGERVVLGSNNWAVAGSLTKSGKPMLANDPHLAINVPALWLPMRFVVGGRPVEGVTLPGIPGIVLGRNDRMAWAFTNVGTDVQDLYREEIAAGTVTRKNGSEKVRIRTETIHVRGGADDAFEVSETSHGPLVTKSLALTWAALDPANLRLPTAAVMLADSPEALNRALDGYRGPGQNVVWASSAGSIGWRMSGIVPIRRPGTDGSVPYDGRDAENDWRGFVPQDAMPRVQDPPSGYVVTANQRVVGSSFPHPVTTDWAEPSRAKRIRDLIEKAKGDGRKLDRTALEAIQLDVLSEPLRDLGAALTASAPKALSDDLRALIQGWDGSVEAQAPQPVLLRAIRKRIRDDAFGAWKIRHFSRFMDDANWVELTRADDAAFRRAGLGPKDAFLARAVREAVGDVSARWGSDPKGWRWGKANLFAPTHPLGLVPGLARVFNPPPFEQRGDGRTVKATSPAYGQSMRFLVDWGEPDAATLVVPFGVSGHLGSAHRFDQLPYWRDGDPSGAATRLSRPAAGSTLTFQP